MKLNKANLLTLFRATSAPVFLAVWFAAPGRAGLIAALVLAALSEASDLLDGYFARRDKTVSTFGKLMDPYADSLFRLTVFFCFASVAHGKWIPLWMPVLLFYRDVVTSIVRLFAMHKGVVVAARVSGKIKAVLQGTAMITLLSLAIIFYDPIIESVESGLIPYMRWTMLGVVVFSIASGIEYLWANRSAFREKEEA